MDRSHRAWLQGMLFVLAVAVIWIVASYVVQSVEGGGTPGGLSPFILTYICNSLFIVYIPIVEIKRFFKKKYISSIRSPLESSDESQEESIHKSDSFFGNLRKTFDFRSRLRELLGSNWSSEDSSLLQKTKVLSNDVSTAGIGKSGKWTRIRTAMVALVICPFWFLAQFTFNLSLQYTSVSSNTILSSISSLFTFLLSIRFLGEKFTIFKLVAVFFSFSGMVVISLADLQNNPGNDGKNTLFGDFLCLFSAFLYAIYTSLIRGLTPSEGGEEEMGAERGESVGGEEGERLRVEGERFSEGRRVGEIDRESWEVGGGSGDRDEEEEGENFSTALLFGYIGLCNLCLLFPIGVLISLLKLSFFRLPTLQEWELVVGKGLLDNVLSDYLWARAVLLTTPTAASTGLQVQVPIALITDSILGKSWPDFPHILGALFIVIGFLGINSTITFWGFEKTWEKVKHKNESQEEVEETAPVFNPGSL